MPTKIIDGIYLGCLKDVTKRSEQLTTLGITHILTVDDRPLPKSIQGLYTCKWVHACDTEQDDLLSEFDSCSEFLDSAIGDGQALVHCRHGVSRSAAVVTAYIMHKSKMPYEEALHLVKEFKADICPNDGFIHQLRLYERMNFGINPTDSTYKRFKLELLSSQIQTAKAMCEVPDDMMTADPALTPQTSHGHTFKCRKCRRILFRTPSVLGHTTGVGEAAFDWRLNQLKLDGKSSEGEFCSQSLFVEPLKWMKKWVSCIEGKLNCPKCDAKLGSFNWVGERCPCGQWVTPSFHIQKNKVDESRTVLAPKQPSVPS